LETGENNLLARTLNNRDTIEGWCSLYRRPERSERAAKDEVRTLLALRGGLDGYSGVCHGGITATLLDEIMSILVAVCRESQGLSPDNLTADLRVRYLRPVPTPSVVLVTAKIRDIQKQRKYFVDAEMVDEHGVALAKGEGLFIHKSMGNL
jgi:thioesterase superfamily protein 4